MKIIIDGDSCHVLHRAVDIARHNGVPLHIYADIHHRLQVPYGTVHIVDSHTDSADFAIVNATEPCDIVITNDGGLASLVLAKHAFCMNAFGRYYNERTVTACLMNRYLRNQTTKQGRKTRKKHKPSLSAYDNRKFDFGKSLMKAITIQQEKEQKLLQGN